MKSIADFKNALFCADPVSFSANEGQRSKYLVPFQRMPAHWYRRQLPEPLSTGEKS
jgi:hypothetical protein